MKKQFILFAAAVAAAISGSRAGAELLYATSGTDLAQFDSASPGVLLPASGAVTGLVGGDTLIGIDTRPGTTTLYGVSSSRIYTINTATRVATQVGTGFTPTASGSKFGIDFNPIPSLIRETGATSGENRRLSPSTGGLSATDTTLTNTNIAEVAYSNNFATPTVTTLYGIDFSADTLVLIGGLNGATGGGPNGGQVTVVGPLGVDTSNAVGFDIAGPSGIAYATLVVGGLDRFYTINLNTGAATLVGTVGASGATQYVGLAAANAVPEPGSLAVMGLGAVGLLARRRSNARKA